jgi:hypothetical protein
VLSIHGDALPTTGAQLLDISRSGTAILADVLLGDPGVFFVLDLPDDSASERQPISCELRWVLAENYPLPQRWLHGAQFGISDERVQRLIDRWVHRARRAGAISRQP